MTGTGNNLVVNPESMAFYIESIKRQFGLSDEMCKEYALRLYRTVDSIGGSPDKLSAVDETVNIIVGSWIRASENKK